MCPKVRSHPMKIWIQSTLMGTLKLPWRSEDIPYTCRVFLQRRMESAVSLKFTTTIHPALCRTICTMKGFDLWSRQDSHIGLLTQHGQNAIKIRDRMQQDKERKREREATYGKSVIIISQASLRAWLPIIECPT